MGYIRALFRRAIESDGGDRRRDTGIEIAVTIIITIIVIIIIIIIIVVNDGCNKYEECAGRRGYG